MLHRFLLIRFFYILQFHILQIERIFMGKQLLLIINTTCRMYNINSANEGFKMLL